MFINCLRVATITLAVVSLAVVADTTVTYQGQLQELGEPYSGEADMEFRLFDNLTDGTQIGATIVLPAVAVTDGLFQVDLDFGEVYGATPAYLEVMVANEPLSPRQRLTAAPLAVHALSTPPVSMTLDDLDDVDISEVSPGEYLQFDGANWLPGPGSNWSASAEGLYYDEGLVGIGSGSAENAEYDLHLIHDQYTGVTGGGFVIENEFNQQRWILYTSQSTSNLALYFNGALRGIFNDASGTYTSTSDDSLKSNVQALESSLDQLMQLKPSKYEFTHQPGEYHFGFLAQELMTVLPELVSVNPDDGSGQGDIHTVSYTEMIPILVSGIQEQQAIIESLRDELNALKVEVQNLKLIDAR